MNIAAQEELVARYDNTAAKLDRARDDIDVLLGEVAELLNEPTSHVSKQLQEVQNQFQRDRNDLLWRGDMLVEADREMAFKIGTTIGTLISPSLAARAIRSGWSYAEAELRAELAALRSLPTGQQINQRARLRELETTIARIHRPYTETGRNGDLDHSFDDYRINPPLKLRAPFGSDRGRDLLIRGLNDTADQDVINQDEFQAIFHENGNLTLVLAGVFDLSDKAKDPSWSYSPEHRSARDLDQEAIPSSKSTLLEDNGYGRRVRDWIHQESRAGNIGPGTPTTIIGHSFGGDTALDLAANREINGDILNITHVIPMAYHNEPQFDDVPSTTQVLAIQNIFDVPVLIENASHIRDDPGEVVRATGRVAVEGLETLPNAVSWIINESINEIEQSVEELHGVRIPVPDIPEVNVKGDDYRTINDHIMLIEFEGGIVHGVGHHQDHYVHLLEGTDNDQTLQFFRDLDAAGFTADGITVAIDVTLPETE